MALLVANGLTADNGRHRRGMDRSRMTRDGPLVHGWRLGLGVLPAFENKFEAVAVGVEHVAGIVTRIPGVSSFISKPFSAEALAAKISKINAEL